LLRRRVFRYIRNQGLNIFNKINSENLIIIKFI
jgi:hypothetical protein